MAAEIQLFIWMSAVLDWIIAQNYWVNPIMNFLIVIACLKYIIFGWGKK